jgi:predicted ATPase
VLQKAEGVPLYVEEITKTLIDAGGLNDAEAEHAATWPSRAVPSTLRDLMQSRLDSLARAKDVAQLGAAIGREFGYALLRALQASDSDLLRTLHLSSESDLRGALEALVNAEVVQRQGTYPEARFVFRHALIQDAAYETILLSARPEIHREIAGALLATEPAIAEIQPEVLAHHFSEAGCMRESSEYFHQAGLRAASRGANVEAGEHFRAALRCLERLPESSDRHERELMTQVELGLTVTALKGYAATEVIEVYERARKLCSLLGNAAALFPVLRGLCTYYMMRAGFETALELATECERIGAESGRADQRIEAMAAIGYTLVYLGRLVEGRRRLEGAVAAYRSASNEYAGSATVRHGVMASLALIAIVAWMQGDHEYAERCSQESIELAQATGRPFDLAYACCFAAMLANFQGDIARAVDNADRGIACATEHAFKDWLMAGKAQRAIAGILRGEASQSRATLETTATQWQASGAELNRHVIIAGHAAATLATFNVAGALVRIDEAIAHGERFHERWLDAEMHRLRGMILEYSSDSAAAAEAYRRAVQIANEQAAPYLALRSAVRLWACDKNAGRATDAAQLVKGILATLPEDARKSAEFAAAEKLLAA